VSLGWSFPLHFLNCLYLEGKNEETNKITKLQAKKTPNKPQRKRSDAKTITPRQQNDAQLVPEK